MEKRKPSYSLDQIKSIIQKDRNNCIITNGVQKSADSMGYSSEQVKDILLDLEKINFYKSATQHWDNNNKTWQDTYKKEVHERSVYIKLKIGESKNKKVIVTSFKPDESI